MVTLEPTSVRFKIVDSFIDFSQGQNSVLTLARVDFLVLRGKTRSSSVVVRDSVFVLCPSELTTVEQFLHPFIGSWFLTVSWP